MGIRNKQRRAAKAKARRRPAHQSAYSPFGDWAFEGNTRLVDEVRHIIDVQAVAEALLELAGRHLDGDPDALAAAPTELAQVMNESPELLDRAAQSAASMLVGSTWQRGWLPADLAEWARRNVGPAAVSYLLDAIADEHRTYPPARVHPQWLGQLRDIGAVMWWEPGVPHLSRWAQRNDLALSGAVRTVVEVFALLMALPTLPRILPLPGTASFGSARPARGVDEKVLARVRGLLAKAESTDYPDEAEALSAKAQDLMARHSLEYVALLADGGHEPEPATARRLWLDKPYLRAKSLLVGAVARANRCRTVFSENIGFVTVLGDEVDLHLVELLTTSLLVQANRAMLADPGCRHGRTRSFRQSFLVAYASRIGERLTASTEQVTASGAARNPALLPVLAVRERVVDELMDEMFSGLYHRSVSISNAHGWHAGRAAADQANLDARPMVPAG